MILKAIVYAGGHVVTSNNNIVISDSNESLIHRYQIALRGDTGWAVTTMFNMCLNIDGEWEYEPSPSNRDDEFKKRCRWSTAEEASCALEAYKVKEIERVQTLKKMK